MLDWIIPLVSSFIPIWENYIVYIFALCFLTFVPNFFKSFLRG